MGRGSEGGAPLPSQPLGIPVCPLPRTADWTGGDPNALNCNLPSSKAPGSPGHVRVSVSGVRMGGKITAEGSLKMSPSHHHSLLGHQKHFSRNDGKSDNSKQFYSREGRYVVTPEREVIATTL